MTLTQAGTAYLDYKQHFRRVRAQSIATYGAHLRRFMMAVGPRRRLGPSLALAEPFLIELSRRGRSDNYVRKAFFVLRNFSGFCAAKGFAGNNPLHDAKAPMLHDRPKRFLSRAQVDSLLAAILRSDRRHARRDYALVATLYYALLRIGEALNSRPEDYDLDACTVRVFGKGGKARLIPFHPRLKPILRAQIRERPKGAVMMFPGQRYTDGATGTLGRVRIGYLLRTNYGPAAGLGPITPHVLRRSGADHLYSGGADLGQIKGLLRHNNVNTTMTYLQVDTPANLKGAWNKL